MGLCRGGLWEGRGGRKALGEPWGGQGSEGLQWVWGPSCSPWGLWGLGQDGFCPNRCCFSII